MDTMSKYAVVMFMVMNFVLACSLRAVAQDRFDYLILNALVFDGSLGEGVRADVGLSKDRIAFVGHSTKKMKAKQVIDGSGLYLVPGFIDPHTHYGATLDSRLPAERANMAALAQGVTTVFLGSDGFGTYKIRNQMQQYEKEGVGTNTAFFVGFGAVRRAVLGSENVTPDAEQIKKMKELVAQGMQEGAFGLSTGLYYAPQSYATTREVIAMAEVAASMGGVYDTHLRSESHGLEQAIEETIEIGRATGIPLMISHIKCLGPSAWGLSEAIIQTIHNAQNEGISIVANQYPFNASHTSLKAMLIPAWAQAGGNAEMVKRLQNQDTLKEVMKGLSRNLSLRGGDSKIVISSKKNPAYHGKSLHQIAVETGQSPEEAAVTILTKHPGISGVSFSMEEDDIINFMKQPWVTTGSDAGGGHPRTYSSFIKKIKEYTIDQGILTMAEAIHRSTGLTATFFGMNDRGFIKQGYYADLMLFDPATLADNATYTDPEQHPTGVRYVFVNGRLVVEDGKHNGVLAGKSLSRTRAD